MSYSPGQSVFVRFRNVGPWLIAFPATFVGEVQGQVRIRDQSGEIIDVEPGNVYPSQEAMEAETDVAVTVNANTGKITRFSR